MKPQTYLKCIPSPACPKGTFVVLTTVRDWHVFTRVPGTTQFVVQHIVVKSVSGVRKCVT